MRKTRRLSDKSATVLDLFVRDPDQERFGLEILKEVQIPSGSLYPILHRFEKQGLLDACWEPLEEAEKERRRPRRLYRLNADSRERAAKALGEWRSATSATGTNPQTPPLPA